MEVANSSLHRFAIVHCGFAARRRITVRVAEVAPGELAEVNFGRLGLVWDPEAGRRRVHHALIVALVHNRHQYVHITASQKIEDLIEGLEDAWAFSGGVPRRVALDNLKSAITKANRYDPIFQRTFAELCVPKTRSSWNCSNLSRRFPSRGMLIRGAVEL